MDTEADPHRPTCIKEMAGDWSRLEHLINTDPPHILVNGSAGCGKSTAIKHILGSRIALWIRCSQDPSLRADNREKIKATARRRVQEGRIHCIVLEHADFLQSDAQAFLRRVIETSTGASRFILEARNLSAMSEPLVSRATLYIAPSLLPYEIRTEIQRRASVTIELADILATQSEGNVRWAVLQGLGGGQGFCEGSLADLPQLKGEGKWAYTLRIMEFIQKTGTNPRSFLGGTGWDRPGGICPWAVTASRIAGAVSDAKNSTAIKQ
jgi:hypothetical protein